MADLLDISIDRRLQPVEVGPFRLVGTQHREGWGVHWGNATTVADVEKLQPVEAGVLPWFQVTHLQTLTVA